MRKFYVCALLGAFLSLFSTNALAQVSSMEDLYGKYSLTFSVNGETPTTMEFQIKESDNQYFKNGMLVNFMGDAGTMNINKFYPEEHKFVVYSPTINGAPLANANGDMPYAANAADKAFSLEVTYNPETKALSFEDMTIVQCDFQAWTCKTLASYTNISATYVGPLDKEYVDVDWSGTYKVEKGQFDNNYGAGKYEYPETFTFTIIKDADKYYVTEFLSQNIEAITNGGFLLNVDGDKATIAEGQLVGALDAETFLYVKGPYGGDIELKKVGNNITNNSYGFSIYEGANAASATNPAYYYGSTAYANVGGDIAETKDYSGTYKVSCAPAYDLSEGAAPAEGTIEIVEKDGKFIVTKFLGMTPFTMDYELMYFTPDTKDVNKGTINSTMLKYVENDANGNYVYWGIADVNLTSDPVAVTFDEDGNLHITDICIAKYTCDASSFAITGTPELVAWYSNMTGVKVAGDEPDAIATLGSENGNAEYFSLSGARLAAPQKGMNIVRKNGVARKVLVK